MMMRASTATGFPCEITTGLMSISAISGKSTTRFESFVMSSSRAASSGGSTPVGGSLSDR